MRRIIFWGWWFFIAVLVTACSPVMEQKQGDEPILRIGGAVYEPYFFQDVNGDYTGIDVEMAKEACKRIGYQPVFTEVDLDERDRMLQNGTIDCMWSCFTMDEHEDDYMWAGPYLYSRRVVVVKADSNIYAVSSLKNKSIAVQANSTSESIFFNETKQEVPDVSEMMTFRTLGEVFTALRKGYVDAIAGHEGALLVYTKDYPNAYRYLNMSIHKSKLGVAFSKDGDAELADQLTQALMEMAEDGSTAEILDRYGLDVDRNIYRGTD